MIPQFSLVPSVSSAGPMAVVPSTAMVLAPVPSERFHWKGALWQSLAFQGVEHGPRILAADAADRHLLLNKPFWSNYWASLGQYNMRRWNDGDSIVVNYGGHPMQGAISGYIEVQNDPRSRDLQLANTREYWNSRFRAFLWATAYSTEFEIGPISEASIFNQGGYTYPLGCKSGDTACERTAKYTNNTGWVDFIVTPVGGTLLLISQDAFDRFISDPLVARHPYQFRYKVLRSSLNPSRSMANMLRGRYPWFRDYDPASVLARERSASGLEPPEGIAHTVDFTPFYSTLSLPDNRNPCRGCRLATSGSGAEVGVHAARFVDVIAVGRFLNNPGSLLPATTDGSLETLHLGVRSGVSSQHFTIAGAIAPGFVTYSHTTGSVAGRVGSGTPQRRFLFSALAAVSGSVRLSSHLSLGAAVEQMVIRYKSAVVDPPGIGEPPRLSFLSHENYINSTNWGVRLGPTLRF